MNAGLTPVPLDARSRDLRRRVVETMGRAGRGHLGSALSLVEILRVLYDTTLTYDASNAQWAGRDRFILSKGHGCLSLYVLLAEKGFFPTSELDRFCRFDGLLGGHPERRIPGVEASTGALGHGLSVGVGFALYGKHEHTQHRVIVLLGDGECDEGSVWEAAMSAAKHRLDNLVAIIDYNRQQSYGPTGDVCELEPFADKWRSFGFATREADGHDVAALEAALATTPYETGKPSVLICHTVKGKGIPFIENDMNWHHKSGMSDEEIAGLMRAIEEAGCEKPV